MLLFVLFFSSFLGCSVGNQANTNLLERRNSVLAMNARKERENNFVATYSCTSACWENVIPGVSTESDVIQIIDQLKNEGVVSRLRQINTGNYSFDLSSGDNGQIAITSDGYVRWVVLYIHGADYFVSQVINSLGEPEAYMPLHWPLQDYVPCFRDIEFPYTGQTRSGYLIYPSMGISYLIGQIPVPNSKVCPYTKVQAIFYYSPQSTNNALLDNHSPAFGFNQFDEDDLVPWHGYGSGY